MFLASLLQLLPLIAAGVGVGAVIAVPVLRRKVPRARSLPRSSRPDAAARILIGVSATVLILLTAVWMILPAFPDLRQHLYDLGVASSDYRWWRYAGTLILGCLVVLVVAILLAWYRRRPQEPVAPSQRRIWRSFTTTSHLWMLSASVTALFLLVAFAGSASSRDRAGRYRILEIETERQDSFASAIIEFFGWAYGLPVAAVSAVLVALTITALHLNAARPFLKPSTARDEEASRSTLSALLVWFTAGTVLLTLSQALRRVSIAAGVSLSTEGHFWETTLAALSPWLFGLALLVQFLAYTVLGLVIVTAFLRSDSSGSQICPAPGRAEPVRTNAHESSAHG